MQLTTRMRWFSPTLTACARRCKWSHVTASPTPLLAKSVKCKYSTDTAPVAKPTIQKPNTLPVSDGWKIDVGSHPLPNEMYMFPLGGCGHIGKNMYVYYMDGKYLIVDFGTQFPGADIRPGVMFLLPDISILQDPDVVNNIVGIVITHGHEDHVGAIPFLWHRLQCPIYATQLTKDYIETRLQSRRYHYHVDFRVVRPGNMRQKIGPFDVEWYPIPHSIPESNAVILRTKKGTVFHTGDWRYDEDPVYGKPLDLEDIRRISKENVLAVVGDSTNAARQQSSGSERKIQHHLKELFKQIHTECNGKIYITFFASNLMRLETVAEATKSIGRVLALEGASLQTWADIGERNKYVQISDVVKDTSFCVEAFPPNNIVIACTGNQAESTSSLMKIAGGNHPILRPSKGDCVIFSSYAIPGNEANISRLRESLEDQGCRVIVHGMNADGVMYHTHVSGHPCQDEIKLLYENLKPKGVVAVHGETYHQVEHNEFAKTKLGIMQNVKPRDGNIVHISTDGPRIVGKVPCEVMYTDTESAPVHRGPIKDIKKKSSGARVQLLILVTVHLDKHFRLLYEPTISMQANTRSLSDSLLEKHAHSMVDEIVRRLLILRRHRDRTHIRRNLISSLVRFTSDELRMHHTSIATYVHVQTSSTPHKQTKKNA
eukprot:m.31972 g.31972  ORF g.31972 m.31972 type:complete len:657 (-) comp8365_c0_seq1:80-2050(-)